MTKPRILIIHNTYFEKGGEDSVVQQDISLLKKHGYEVYTCFFSNEAFRKPGWKMPLLVVNLFYNLIAYVRVYRMVKKNRIGFVHVHNFFYTASASVFWAAKAAGATIIFTVHNYRLFCLNGFFFRNGATCMQCEEQQSFRPGIEHHCFKSSGLASRMLASTLTTHRRLGTWQKKIDRYIVLNPLVQELLIKNGIPQNKILSRHNFLNACLEQPAPAYADRDEYYLFVGRISEEKGIRPLVEAFRKTSLQLRIVGDGPLAVWIKEHAGDNISYHEAIPREQLFSWYASCKALVFPSLWPEGQPMVILEAQSTGTLTIAARSAITTEMVGDRYGILYDIGSVEHLLSAIAIFEQTAPEQLQQMSETTLRHFRETHTETAYLRALPQVYA